MAFCLSGFSKASRNLLKVISSMASKGNRGNSQRDSLTSCPRVGRNSSFPLHMENNSAFTIAARRSAPNCWSKVKHNFSHDDFWALRSPFMTPRTNPVRLTLISLLSTDSMLPLSQNDSCMSSSFLLQQASHCCMKGEGILRFRVSGKSLLIWQSIPPP